MATTNIKKKSTAQGNKFSYKYTDLATIHEELEVQGITYYQYTEFDEKSQADYIYTVIKYGDDKEGKPLRGVKILDGNTLVGGNICQQYGSSISYCRRYSLLMALGWATEDDDAASVGSTDVHPAQQNHASNDTRLDFDRVKTRLLELQTVEEVEEARKRLDEKFPKMSDKQRNAINRIFADRKDQITEPAPRGWVN